MLTQSQIDIVKSTVPVLEQHGNDITKVFYTNMFNDHSELLDIFNKTNQSQGRQQTALATTVLAAAKHIEQLAVLLPQVTQISHKHRALQIQPEHYPIVGKHLLRAIKQVLGDAATDEIMTAWEAAYAEIAKVFINVEQTMYRQAEWQGFQPFKVVKKQITGTDIAQFSVLPTEGNPVELNTLDLKPGQYITVKVKPANSDHIALRHYSLTSATIHDGLQFAVRRDNRNAHEGLVSNYLHDEVEVGDEILLSAPAGDFLLDEMLATQNQIPLVLISAGVGITPVLAMLERQIAINPNRKIIWAYACQDSDYHAFSQEVETLLGKASQAELHKFYFANGELLEKSWLANLPNPADIYICGSVMFMEQMIGDLLSLNHAQSHVHYEPFGPKMSLQPQVA